MTISKEVFEKAWQQADDQEKIKLLKCFRPDIIREIREQYKSGNRETLESARQTFADELGINLDDSDFAETPDKKFLEDLK